MSRRFVLLCMTAAALVACGRGPSGSQTANGTPSASPSPSASFASTVTDTAKGISFQRPIRWARWQPNDHNPITDGPLIYLSTDDMLPTCAMAPGAPPNAPDAQGRACDWPLAVLAPNGVLITWLTTRILEPLPSEGDVIDTNGSTARIKVERPGSCGTVGGDETITVLAPIGQPTPLSNVAFVACLRGPDLAIAEAQVREMLASVTIRQ